VKTTLHSISPIHIEEKYLMYYVKPIWNNLPEYIIAALIEITRE
jgi:hypothetical protein